MAKFEVNPRVVQIFEDLEKYLQFCREYGYVYNEAELYSNRSFTYRQFTKWLQGKPAKDMWETDGKPAQE